MPIFKKSYLDFRIAEVEKELKAVSREIRVRERFDRRQRRLAGSRFPVGKPEGESEKDRENASRRRLASYLSAGSVQTIAHHKFRSDLVRRRRLLLGGAVLVLAAAVWIVWKLVS